MGACLLQGFLEEVQLIQPPPSDFMLLTLNAIATMPVSSEQNFEWIVTLFGSFLCTLSACGQL